MKKNFKVVIDQPYGARDAGYTFDMSADRGYDKDMALRMGERLSDDKLDQLYDLDGALYEDENGDPYAVVMWAGKPFCWQKLRKAEYKIRPEFADKWGAEVTEDTVIKGEDIVDLARGWEISVDEVRAQLQLID